MADAAEEALTSGLAMKRGHRPLMTTNSVTVQPTLHGLPRYSARTTARHSTTARQKYATFNVSYYRRMMDGLI